MLGSQSHHAWQVLGQFLFAAAGQQGDDGARVVGEEGGIGGAALDDFQQGVAHVGGLGQVVLGVEVLLEGQYVAQTVQVAAHALEASFLPGPQLGRDVVDGFDALGVCPLLNLEVEAGVVDADDGVGVPAEDVLLAEADVAQHGAQVQHHFDEAHDGQVADVALRLSGGLRHGVAAPEAELRLRVLLAQGLDEVGPIEVARGLAGYDVVSHFNVMLWVRNRTNMKGMKVRKSTVISVFATVAFCCLI